MPQEDRLERIERSLQTLMDAYRQFFEEHRKFHEEELEFRQEQRERWADWDRRATHALLSLSLLKASPDDEPYTPEQQAADGDSIASIQRGEGIPHQEILREFGFDR